MVKTGDSKFIRCAGMVLFAMVLCVGISFQYAFELMGDHHDTHVAKTVEDHPAMGVRKIGTEPLEHEEMFTNTLKSCLPSYKGEACKTFVPESTERIGIIVPPGDIATSFLQLITSTVRHGKKIVGSNKATEIELIPTPHMPPYGYGKTHGYTRLIRVVPQPLLVGATDSLLAASKEMEANGDKQPLTLDDIKGSLRQQIRYHCRLNHVSAHTALWTIGLEEVAEMQTDELIDRIQEFLGLERGDEKVVETIMAEAMKVDNHENAISKLDHLYAQGAMVLSLMQTKHQGVDLLQILDQVLRDEMKISKNLTAWPCESFWKVGDPKNRLELSPVLQRISKAMSPNCTAPFTSCFVKRDKCEYAGDGKCS